MENTIGMFKIMSLVFDTISASVQKLYRKRRGKLFENILLSVHNLLITLKATSMELVLQFWE